MTDEDFKKLMPSRSGDQEKFNFGDHSKLKKQCNQFIYLLEQLPRFDKQNDISFGKMLSNQIELLDDKYQREYDPALLLAFKNFKQDLATFMHQNVDLIDRRMKRNNKGKDHNDDTKKIDEGELVLLSVLRRLARSKINNKRGHREKQMSYGQALT